MMRLSVPSLPVRGRAAAVWLACWAVLSNALMPAVLTAAVGMLNPGGDAVGSVLCKAASVGDVPGKPKPGLPVHHCALCTVPAIALAGPQAGVANPYQAVLAAYAGRGTLSPPAPPRHGPVQARAPPGLA